MFGHIHEGYGVATMDLANGETIFVNAATNTRQYKCEQSPVWLEMNNGKLKVTHVGKNLSEDPHAN